MPATDLSELTHGVYCTSPLMGQTYLMAAFDLETSAEHYASACATGAPEGYRYEVRDLRPQAEAA